MRASFASILLPSLSIGIALCAPEPLSYQNPHAICYKYTIPLNVTSDNWVFNATKFSDNLDLANFVTASSSVNSSNVFYPVEAEPVTQTHQVNISGTFCQSKKAGPNSTVIVATHGIGGDGTYWNSPFKPQHYNFVDQVAPLGYSVFYYDRVGVGQSTKLSGYVNQLSVEVEALRQLVKLVKAGRHTGTVGVPKSVVVIGFSFGSFVTNTLVANEPGLMSGAIFTGLGFAPTAFAPFFEAYSPRIASHADPKFAGYDTGVLTWVDLYANINTYFKKPNYELDAVEYTETYKQPFTVGEALSLQFGLGVNPNAQNFTGPVLVLSGEFDFFACAGYCPGFLEDNVSPLFSGSKSLEVAIHPDSGHSINFNKNATGAFGVITNFLQRNRL